jgi:hypothetical protein
MGTRWYKLFIISFPFFSDNAASSKAGNTELAISFTFFTDYLPLLHNGNILELSGKKTVFVSYIANWNSEL